MIALHHGPGVFDPVAQDGAGFTRINDLGDAEFFCRSKRRTDPQVVVFQRFSLGDGIVRFLDLLFVRRHDPAFDGDRAPACGGPGKAVVEVVTRFRTVQGPCHAETTPDDDGHPGRTAFVQRLSYAHCAQ
ncbi:hypothetical protein D3C80_1765250 [compost metagenome]